MARAEDGVLPRSEIQPSGSCPAGEGRTVLDCCTHTGSFALNAAKAGAARVIAADISASALASARHNAQLNGFGSGDGVCAGRRFRSVSGSEVEGAGRRLHHSRSAGVYQIPQNDPQRLSGLLPDQHAGDEAFAAGRAVRATASCSHFMEDAMFEAMLQEAARNAKVELRQIEVRHQAPDHPI